MLALAGQAGRAEASFVFDEIDAGIGGKAARAVGERFPQDPHGDVADEHDDRQDMDELEDEIQRFR